uniref:hexokinase n=1 Tax=Gouania willdenowi TaxID=441366 RepID=A0A8C5GAY6_GOUWI
HTITHTLYYTHTHTLLHTHTQLETHKVSSCFKAELCCLYLCFIFINESVCLFDLLMKDLIKGLGKHSHHKAAVKMLPTFVRSMPDGTEHGDFLALDLGGTNFRVLHVRVLEEEKVVDILGSQTCSISQDIMLGTGEQLFDHIAACLADFISSQNLKGQTLPLGFTFSFSCEQKKIDESILLRWTKGFNCSGVEGRDIVQLLKEAVQRRGDFTIGFVAMVNDTVGTMMSCGYRDQSCEIGLIIGTGTNACYMEEMRNVKRVEGEDGRMCINTEWGGFGDDGTLENIITDINRTIDQTSIKPGVHIFEKMISGMYLGELVRLLLVKLTEQKLLFKGQRSTTLLTAGTFPTKFISEIEEPLSGLENAKRILSSLNVPYDSVDARIVRLVCDTVSSRTARLCAAALATIANRIRVNRGLKHLKTTVGMVRLLAPDCDITFILSQDGSGKGAAMVTAVAQRLALQSHLDLLMKDLIKGLGKHSHHKAAVKMLPTFVRSTPDGTEHGDFLALDLGGTNFRVLHVRVLEEEKVVDILGSQTCSISQDIMLGTGEQLFDHIAACLADFISSQNLKEQTLPLGFTFSFPCEQKKIDESILIRWTKGFNCSGVEGRDIVQLLKEAVQRRGVSECDFTIGSVAMVNDTVGTMMSCGYRDQSCEIGLIIGTGTNACYMEEMRNVKRVEGEDGRMCINTEWGGFGDDGTLENIITDIDRTIDQTSIKPGVHIFEKMISGMYLGELVRLLLVKLTEQKLLFKGQRSTTLLTAGTFPTKFISEIEEPLSGLENAKRILSSLNVPYDFVDARIVRLVCDTVSSRSARLCAAALATVANRIRVNRGLKHLKTTVGVDGTVYKKHPNFSDELQAMVRLLAPDCDVTFILSQDGSGKGAAMVTAVAQRLALQSHLLEDSDGDSEEED